MGANLKSAQFILSIFYQFYLAKTDTILNSFVILLLKLATIF